jgi:hypothetical protein
MIKRLFIDIETCPMITYTWNIGREVSIGHENIIEEPRIICIAYKWEGKPPESFDWGKKRCDKSMLDQIVKIIASADEVIAHNGDRFDVPWIRTRCLKHGIRFPYRLPSVDTLKQARSGFRFPSNRLDYLGQYMGHGNKKETGGFGLWKAVMDGDKEALFNMVEYCKRDVELLENVWGTLYDYTKPTTHMGVQAGGYKHWCPKCGSSNVKLNGNKKVSAAGVPRIQLRCKECKCQYMMNETQARREMLREKEDNLLSGYTPGEREQ